MTGAKTLVLEQNNRVSTYFDRISSGYSSRYSDRSAFHSYFFRQRLKAATDRFVFDGKRVLDIGAGTGALYDELIRRCQLSPAVVMAVLLELELAGRLERHAGNRVSLVLLP